MDSDRRRQLRSQGDKTSPRIRVILALVVLILTLAFSGSSVLAEEPNPQTPHADLGDAPDSTNHHAMDNTAYASVPGRFPTVFADTPRGEGVGPIHHNPRIVWLGDKVSLEDEADQGPDQEMDASGSPINNILAKGADNADNDRGDDGWLNRGVPLPDCQEATLRVRVRKDPATTMKEAFLNVWIDGNRDGDWQDIGKCEPDGHSNEWIVQDFPIDLTSFSDFIDIDVKTILVYNEKPDMPAWMRFTLSDERAVHLPPVDQPNPNEPPTQGLTDGRGPENGFKAGETEDYLRLPGQEPEVKPDFGDAPDSSNHYPGMNNVAYPAVPTNGRFPSVWEGTPAGAPSGPMHANPYASWLGDRVSSEKDADLPPDADPTTNILNNGTDPNASDKDEFDDGWRNGKETRFVNCEETTLRVRVSRNPATPGGKMFLNVYYDGDRSGDWGQRKICDTSAADPNHPTYAHEWIVENFVIDTSAIAGFADIPVPTLKVLNNNPAAPAWVRFTLSEEPVVELAPFEHDGRGPDWPKHYRFGETEDYLHRPPDNQGQPGDLVIVKTHSEADNTVSVGDPFTYTIEINHVGGTAPATVVMSDRLPAEVQLLHGPFVTLVTGNATPLAATFDSSVPPSGGVSWSGHLAPDTRLRIEVEVGVRRCPPADRQVIHNVARLFSPDGKQIADASADVKTQCDQPQPPQIQLHKRVVRLNADGGAIDIPNQPDEEFPILAGQEVAYELTLESTSTIAGEVVISDSMPAGVVATQVHVDRGEATLRDNGAIIIWRLRVGPDTPPAHARIQVKPTERLQCNKPVVNIAHWIFYHGNEELLRGQSNPAKIRLVCADLGDAPDSSNNAGVAMDAYPGVPGARFPTVFNVAAPERGPKHLVTRPFHLGKGVTEEREADLGVDMDPTNNILPKLNRPDMDGRDDGLVLSELTFAQCQIAKFPVWVSIDAGALAAMPADAKGIGYVNVWLDSNRDGDWQDPFTCPPVNNEPSVSWEHIVIDHPVDVAALGPGLHKIYLTTNWPVFWPTEQDKRPAWMRVTLAELVSNKTLDCGAGTCHIGDGRGYDAPFRLGETEDYLVRSHSDQPGGEGADPSVRKEGHLRPERDPATGDAVWLAEWSIRYKNVGSGLATNVVVTDALSGPQALDGQRSAPVITPVISSNSLTYAVGNLGPGAEGQIGLRSILPIDTAPGTIITNTVTITADSDTDTSNNTSVVTLTVPLLPPLITYPTPGTTCTGTFTITGRVQPGATVNLTIVDSSTGTTVDSVSGIPPDSSGQWSHAVVGLPDGEYDISATAMLGGVSSPTTTVHLIVDSTLFWNPLSLRFTADDGHVSRPHDEDGRTDEDGWRIFLRRGTVYTASLTICCDDPNAVVTLELGTVAMLTLTDPDGDGTYTATFTTPSTGPITGRIRICVICHLIKVCSDGEVTIDPEGTIFDITTGLPVSSSAVACMAEQVSGAGGQSVFSLWPAEDFDQINPQTTGGDGYFSFFTPAGTYQLQVSKSGYQAYRSQDLTVVDAPVHFDVPLTPHVAEAATHTVLLTAEGFDPAVLTVEPGAVVEFVNMDVAFHSSRSTSPAPSYGAEAAELKSSDAWDSGLLGNGASYKRILTAEGTYSYTDAENPASTGTIIVEKAAASQIFLYLPAVER